MTQLRPTSNRRVFLSYEGTSRRAIAACLASGLAFGCTAADPQDDGELTSQGVEPEQSPATRFAPAELARHLSRGPFTVVHASDPEDGGRLTKSAVVEIAAGAIHTCVRLVDGHVRCFGGNAAGELGDDRSRHGDCSPPDALERIDCSMAGVAPVGLSNSVELSSRGGQSTCSIDQEGVVRCWGREPAPRVGGDLVSNRARPVAIDALEGADAIRVGQHDICAVRDGDVLCFGDNRARELGDGSDVPRLVPVALPGVANAIDAEVSTFGRHVCVLLSNGDVACLGDDRYGQLGTSGDAMERCGDEHPGFPCRSTVRRVEGLGRVVDLSLGEAHTCALDSDGLVSCFGSNEAGQLGDGTFEDRRVPVPVFERAIAVTAGVRHTCVLDESGDVHCTGANGRGELGDGEDHATCALDGTREDCSPRFVRVATASPVTTVTAGLRHTCAQLEEGDLVCWGWNLAGQLGDGGTHDAKTPVRVTALDG